MSAAAERVALRMWQRRGQKMPVAIALGGEPVLPYAATAPLPPGMDEALFAGFLNRGPIEPVREDSKREEPVRTLGGDPDRLSRFIRCLLAQAQLFDKTAVAVRVSRLQVIQQFRRGLAAVPGWAAKVPESIHHAS